MKKYIWLFALLALAPLSPAFAGDSHETWEPYKGSAEFERLKSLAGEWQGTSKTGEESDPLVAEYVVSSGGTIVIERLFAHTPHEMVSIYEEDGGKVVMTHYCMLRNKPKMSLTSADNNTMRFDLTTGNDFDASKDRHMHSLIVAFEGDDEIQQQWTCFNEGKNEHTTVVDLKRVPPTGPSSALTTPQV